MPTIDAITKSVSSSFPDHFPVLLEIKFVEFSIILPPVTDLMFTVQYLRPEWGKGEISQDGQVTILDLPKVDGIPYLEVSSLQPYTSQYFIVSKLPCTTDDGKFQPYLLLKGLAREYYFCALAWSTVWVHLYGQILGELNRSM